LPQEVIDQHRAVESLIEELEAVMWYHQRAAVTQDASLKQVLIHNRDEEIEHACMNLEWLRRNFPEVDENLRTYLFTEAPITEVEEQAEGQDQGSSGQDEKGSKASQGSLNIGSMNKNKGE
jgi:hypothetical protein